MNSRFTIDFRPKLFSTLRGYTKSQFSTDFMAGIIVGIVAIPLAIAFGIASGVGPTEGLVTAIIAGLLISSLFLALNEDFVCFPRWQDSQIKSCFT